MEIAPNAPEFLRQFVRQTAPEVYLPLVVFGLHEHFSLKRLQSQYMIAGIDWTTPSEGDLAAIIDLEAQLAVFRQQFLVSQASSLTHHNHFLGALRSSLGSPDMRREIEEAIRGGAQFVREFHSRRWRRWVKLGGLVGVALVAHEVVEIVGRLLYGSDVIKRAVKVLTPEKTQAAEEYREFLLAMVPLDRFEWAAAGIAILVAFVTFVLSEHYGTEKTGRKG